MVNTFLFLKFSQYIHEEHKKEELKGFAIVSFTITESGSVENAKAIEGYCGDPTGPESELRPCTMFNSASARAALKLKYKPKIVDGKATSVSDVLHRFTFIMSDEEGR